MDMHLKGHYAIKGRQGTAKGKKEVEKTINYTCL